MDSRNRELLNKVIERRLSSVLEADSEEERGKKFNEAMEAVDRQIELSKLDASWEEQIEKRKLEEKESIRDKEFKEKEAKKTMIIRIVEIATTLILSPIIDHATKKAFAKLICNFEKDYTFTTLAGKSLSSLFRFKK